MKKIYLFIFAALITICLPCPGEEFTFEIVGHHSYGYLWKFDGASKKATKFENFTFNPRSSFIDILVFENGTAIKNRFFQWASPSKKFIHGSFGGTNYEYFPNQIYSRDLSDKYSPWYDTRKTGKYFVMFIVKKGKNWNDGLWFSNVLEMKIIDKKIVSSQTISKINLPKTILDGFHKQLKELAELEGGDPEKTLWLP